MNEEGISKLRQRIAENPLQDEDDLLFYIQYASRMAALGATDCFDQIVPLVKEKYPQTSLDDLLKDRCKTGIWDLQEQTGDELGLSLIEAQDFSCFYRRAIDTGLVSSAVSPLFNEWAKETRYTAIDEETVDILERFLELYPLPKEERLSIISYPVTVRDSQLLEDLVLSRPLKRMSGTWKQKPLLKANLNAFSKTCFASPPQYMSLACDSDKPSTDLLREQDRLYCTVETPFGEVTFQRTLNDKWKVILEVDRPEEWTDRVLHIRIGSLRMTPVAGRPGRWTLDLSPWSGSIRIKVLSSPVVFFLAREIYLTVHYNAEIDSAD